MTSPSSTEEKRVLSFLSIERLCVYSRQGAKVFDQRFHSGLNVIRSRGNTTGKSTICEFIFYLLGGTVEKWSDIANACNFIIGQVSICSAIITMRRYMPSEDTANPGIDIYYGPMDEAATRIEGWVRYPWRRSKEVESYSEYLFRALGLPGTRTDRESNITMHEILRLMYSDQDTSADKIFRDQDFNDSETRQTVGELLLGYDDLKLHELRQELRNLEVRKSKEEHSLSAIKGILDAAYPELRIFDFNKLEAETTLEIDQAKLAIVDIENSDRLRKTQINSIRRSAEKSTKEISEQYSISASKANSIRRDLQALDEDIQDSYRFVSGLDRKLSALKESQISIEAFGGLSFERCPSCLAPIETHEKNKEKLDSCNLCKSPLISGNIATRRLRLQNEISNQQRESKAILIEKELAFNKYKEELIFTEKRMLLLQSQYDSINKTPNIFEQRLRELYTKIGYLENKIEDIREKGALAQRISIIAERITQISYSIDKVNAEIRIVIEKRRDRKMKIETLISELTVNILHKDITSDEALDKASQFEFDFSKDRLIIDGRFTSRLSASTTTFMKSAFFFALFMASLDDDEIRIPRFMIIDSIEDKGIVPERVRNLHHIMIEEIQARGGLGQLIITTSLPSEEIDAGKFGIGPIYTPASKTLKFEGDVIGAVNPKEDGINSQGINPTQPNPGEGSTTEGAGPSTDIRSGDKAV